MIGISRYNVGSLVDYFAVQDGVVIVGFDEAWILSMYGVNGYAREIGIFSSHHLRVPNILKGPIE